MFQCRTCSLRLSRAAAVERSIQDGLRPLRQTRLASSDVVQSHSQGEPYLNHAQLLRIKKHSSISTQAPEVGGKPNPKSPWHRQLSRELVWLQDRIKLADRVNVILKKDGDSGKALELCRLASRQMQCLTSWNRCIDWHMSKGEVTEALKIYNEMKKRAQFPDSRTYMTLIHGLVKTMERTSVDPKRRASQAVSLYHSMNSPTSKVRPSILHTNAVLHACSLGDEMDALWGIVAQIPEQGTNSADNVTYTTILNALFHSVKGNEAEQGLGLEKSMAQARAVEEARRIWRVVIRRWQAGEVQIDEPLVVAMGKILVLSPDIRDVDDVFSLVQQTVGIPRQIEKIGTPTRHTEHLERPLSQYLTAEDSIGKDGDDAAEMPAMQVFNTDVVGKVDGPGYVSPSNALLSVIINACTCMRLAKVGRKYWNIFTEDYGVKPDLFNVKALLADLRQSRMSRDAAVLINNAQRDNWPLDRISFARAMCACRRDKNNPNVLENARSIITAMFVVLDNPSYQAMADYLDLATATQENSRIIDVLNHIQSILPALQKQIAIRDEGPTVAEITKWRDSAWFLQKWLGVIHTLLEGNNLSDQELKNWRDRRNMLNQLLDECKQLLARHDGTGRDGISRTIPRHSMLRDRPGTAPAVRSRHGSVKVKTGARSGNRKP